MEPLPTLDELESQEPPLLTAPPTLLPLPTPQQGSKLETSTFDMIAELLSAGVPHIAEQILLSLDVTSLVMAEQVSSVWRDVIEDLHIWKVMVEHKINSNPLWKALFKKRGWHKYLFVPPAKEISRQFYRQLYHIASVDIDSLEANWRRGHYTSSRVETGSQIWCLQYDDAKIVTGQRDNTIKIWDRSTLQLLKVLEGHNEPVICLQYSEEVIISGSADHTVKVWDIHTGQMMNDLLHHKDAVHSLKFTTDTLVTGCNDETVSVWDIKSPTDIALRMTLKGHEDPVFSVDLSETYIISGSGDGAIKVWDISTGELVRALHGHIESVECLQLQRSYLISGSHDKTVRIWNVDTGECIRVLHEHNDWVMCVAISNQRILSGSFDNTIKVWDLPAALNAGSSNDILCIATLKEHAHWVWAVQCDDFQVISGSFNGTLLILDFLHPTPPILRT